MPKDENLNPAAALTELQIAKLEKRIDDLKGEYIQFFNHETKLPPEKKREDLELAVRKLIYGGAKTARMDMIIQNLAQRFNLYNNMWLKKLSEMEFGGGEFKKKKAAAPPSPPHPPKKARDQRDIYITLNDEETFARLVEAYQELLPSSGRTEREREKIINSMKSKMLTHNLVEAHITFTVLEGKLSIRIKK